MKDTPRTVKLSLSRADRELIRRYGYPFQGIEDAIDAVPESVDVADVLCEQFEVELLCNDLVKSINDCTDDDLQEEINELFEYIESEVAAMKRQRSVPPRPSVKPETKAALLRAIERDLESAETPEVQLHYKRLMSLGQSDTEARKLLATAMLSYLNDTENEGKHTRGGYVAHLERPPEIDWGEDADEAPD